MLCTDYLLLPLIKIPHFLPTEQAGVRNDILYLRIKGDGGGGRFA
jgi:hypothetical protein